MQLLLDKSFFRAPSLLIGAEIAFHSIDTLNMVY